MGREEEVERTKQGGYETRRDEGKERKIARKPGGHETQRDEGKERKMAR